MGQVSCMGQVNCTCDKNCRKYNEHEQTAEPPRATDAQKDEVLPASPAVTAKGSSYSSAPASHRSKVGWDENFATAKIKFEQGQFEEAEVLFRQVVGALEVLDSDPVTRLRSITYLADTLVRNGNEEEAIVFLRTALALGDQKLGPEHPASLRVLKHLHASMSVSGMKVDDELGQRFAKLKQDMAFSKKSSTHSFAGTRTLDHLLLHGDEDMQKALSHSNGERIVLITDLGQDNDDEMALLLLGELVRKREAEVLAVVANLQPANRRAALARGTLDLLGMVDVPVGIGTDGGSKTHMDTFSAYISKGKTGVDYFSPNWASVQQLEKVMGTDSEDTLAAELNIYDGQTLLLNVLKGAADQSLTLVLCSSLKDAALLLRNHEDLFVRKIRCVTIMGGVQKPESGGLLEASDAGNNLTDFESAQFFYRRCQEICVPLVVLSRFTAYGCPVQKKVYDLMVRRVVPHPTVCRLQRAQRDSIETLWAKVCAGDKLPARCDKRWFCDTFCDGIGTERGAGDSMWDLVQTFNEYDPMAILAAIKRRRDLFFKPTEYVGVDGKTVHLIIGESKQVTGIKSVTDLHDFMMSHWIRAAGRQCHLGDIVLEGRPSELDQEQLTAALTPMQTHTPEELEKLNMNVLRLLDVEWPKLKSGKDYDDWKTRDRLMRSIGPEMRLVDPHTIFRLERRIPHSAEQITISMEDAAQRATLRGGRFFIEMFSHRWHLPYAPDDGENSKARVLWEWSKYRASMGLQTFFWIDYACINQSDIAPGVAMLPLYVSCCHNIVCYDTASYETRAWCRMERLLFSTFVAPNNEYITPDFKYSPNSATSASGELVPRVEKKDVVPDPNGEDAQITFKSDSELISRLKRLCMQHWAVCWKDGLVDIVEKKGGLQDVRRLSYGKTQLRLRKF